MEEEESGNIYHRSQPEFLHQTDDIDNDGHLHEILVEMS